MTVTLTQQAVSYVASTNTSRVAVTIKSAGASIPWAYVVAVRGMTVATGVADGPTATVTVDNACSVYSQSVTVTVTDALARTAQAAATLSRSLCPPPPAVPFATARILAGPTLTQTSFVDRLRAVGSPALAEGKVIYQTLVDGGVNPAFALGMFHAESSSGTKGYAVTTKNWGNILYYTWEVPYGAVPYAPGNGYTYAKYPTWTASVRALVDLLGRYDRAGYRTISPATARWLGTVEGSDRHLRYLTNITNVMARLPDDAVPKMTGLTVPASSKAVLTVSWSASDNLVVTGYQFRIRQGTGAWSAAEATTARSRRLELPDESWTVGVRATDDAGNWSTWRTATTRVDTVAPTMTALTTSNAIVKTISGRFTAAWSATDDVGVARYEWRTRRADSTAWNPSTWTTRRTAELSLPPADWVVAVRARDAARNWSAWRETRVVVPHDDRSFRLSTGMIRRTNSGYYRGSATTTDRRGSTMTATFTGRRVFVIGTVAPRYGKFRVAIDGVTVATVDAGRYKGARATTVHRRVLLWSSSTLAAGSHTMTITNLATSGRPRIGIDSIGFRR
jgi:hypothetical protein